MATWGDLIRFEELPAAGVAERSVLFVTNMWPDERRSYYGSFIASQARSLSRAGVEVDVLYVRGFLGGRAYLKALGALPLTARRKRYDVTHVHYGHTAVAGIGIRGRPSVISFAARIFSALPAPTGSR